MISVLISTRNRPEHIQRCLQAIFTGTYQQFEILLVDQSDDERTKRIIRKIRSNKIIYFKSQKRGKAIALNEMVRRAIHPILAFTDDDCIADKNWLSEIDRFYKKHETIAGVFGNTYPYEPDRRADTYCTSTFESKRVTTRTNPYAVHWRVLGIGNNMSFKKSALIKMNLFKEWLGPGSIAWEGEETDMIFRLQKHKFRLMTNPRMIIYHNRWLSKKQLLIQLGVYSCGMTAFYTYYVFCTRDKKMLRLLKKRFYSYISRPLARYLEAPRKLYVHESIDRIDELITVVWELFCFVRGFCVGAWKGLYDRRSLS